MRMIRCRCANAEAFLPYIKFAAKCKQGELSLLTKAATGLACTRAKVFGEVVLLHYFLAKTKVV
jgi:hypothetical protein